MTAPDAPRTPAAEGDAEMDRAWRKTFDPLDGVNDTFVKGYLAGLSARPAPPITTAERAALDRLEKEVMRARAFFAGAPLSSDDVEDMRRLADLETALAMARRAGHVPVVDADGHELAGDGGED